MTSKERVLKAIDHRAIDQLPVFTTLTPQVAEKMSNHLGIDCEPPLDSMLSTRISHPNILTSLGNDCVGIAACSPTGRPTMIRQDGLLENEWGMVFKPFGLYNEFHTYPLAQAETPADVIQYPFPEPDAPGRFDAARETIDRYSDEYAIVADLETVMFETAWYLVGFEKFLTDLALEAEYVSVLLDRILEYHLIIAKRLIEMGADIIWAGDDFGTQKGMLMSPVLWRRHFKPRIQYLFQKFKQFNPDIRIAWHSCGSILPIIPDFIEIGLDILNPIQPKAAGMEPKALKNMFGDRLSFFGGIDIQHLIPFGTPNEIRKGVWETASILAEGGGYLAGPAHNIQDDTPVENILAFFGSCRDFRIKPAYRNS